MTTGVHMEFNSYAQFSNKESMLMMCLKNDLRGINIDPCPDLCGFILRDSATEQALYTAYVAEHGFSSYVAINDICRGLEISDETPLAIKAPLFTAVAKIKTHHRLMNPDAYAVAMERDEAYRSGITD
jgi:hypothetical protein